MRKLIIAIQAGALLCGLAACEKKPTYEANEKDAVAHISVVNEKGNPLAGAAVLIFDEKGYEQFQKDRKTEPQALTLTLRNGQVNYRLAYQQWFTSGSRVVTFVVMEEIDENNYQLWSVSRTIKASEQVNIKLEIDRSSTGQTEPIEPGESGNKGETGDTGKPDSPADPAGTPFEMFDAKNGHTLFGDALFLDEDHLFDGSNRYTIADAGLVEGLKDLNVLKLDRAAHRISVWPKHGYFVCKDISLMEFPSGKRALAVGAEYVRIHVKEWITRDEQPIGVKFDYTLEKASGQGLPETGKIFDVKLANDRSVTIPLPSMSADSECVPWGKTPLRFSFSEDHVTAQIMDPQAAAGKEYRFVIRLGACYSEAKLRIVE